jgi:hypothetical protein
MKDNFAVGGFSALSRILDDALIRHVEFMREEMDPRFHHYIDDVFQDKAKINLLIAGLIPALANRSPNGGIAMVLSGSTIALILKETFVIYAQDRKEFEELDDG